MYVDLAFNLAFHENGFVEGVSHRRKLTRL
jgi:hypothetical protein